MVPLLSRNPIGRLLAGLAAGAALSLAAMACSFAAQPGPIANVPAPLVDSAPGPAGKLQTAIVSGGCFWGVQGVFQHVRGVTQAVSGYAGGAAATAHYEVVSTGVTGHAESVMITFDPRQISYGQILRIFFSVATDPTQVNEQYPDEGTQYRSEIFYLNPEQKKVAEAYIAQIDKAKVFPAPIATRVDPNTGFYRAEDHHQDFLRLNPTQGYIARFDLPKIAALKAAFPALYRETPITTAKPAA
jgi:peptide-methionine (S)-S-oxide reductase